MIRYGFISVLILLLASGCTTTTPLMQPVTQPQPVYQLPQPVYVAPSAAPVAVAPQPQPIYQVPQQVPVVPQQPVAPPVAAAPAQPTVKPPQPQAVQQATNCSVMIEGEHHPPTLGVLWTLPAITEDRILHVWSNHWDPNLPEYKFFVPAGRSVAFMSGGGSEWRDRPGCTGVARTLFQRDPFREITLAQYQAYIDEQLIP